MIRSTISRFSFSHTQPFFSYKSQFVNFVCSSQIANEYSPQFIPGLNHHSRIAHDTLPPAVSDSLSRYCPTDDGWHSPPCHDKHTPPCPDKHTPPRPDKHTPPGRDTHTLPVPTSFARALAKVLLYPSGAGPRARYCRARWHGTGGARQQGSGSFARALASVYIPLVLGPGPDTVPDTCTNVGTARGPGPDTAPLLLYRPAYPSLSLER